MHLVYAKYNLRYIRERLTSLPPHRHLLSAYLIRKPTLMLLEFQVAFAYSQENKGRWKILYEVVCAHHTLFLHFSLGQRKCCICHSREFSECTWIGGNTNTFINAFFELYVNQLANRILCKFIKVYINSVNYSLNSV